MTQQMLVKNSPNRNPQFTGMGPIQLQRSARFPILRKEYFLVRPILQPPHFDPPLKRAQMLLFDRPRFGLLEMFEQGLGLQIRGLAQHGLGSNSTETWWRRQTRSPTR